PHDLAEIHLPPVLTGIGTGAVAFMAAYNDIDGVPCCANPDLLTRLLRDQHGFEGVVMADMFAVDRLADMTGDLPSAGPAALPAPPQDTDRHAEGIRLEAARESARIASRDLAARSLVLLADDDLTLPLDPQTLRRIAVVGPYANDVPCMLGDYVAPQPEGSAL